MSSSNRVCCKFHPEAALIEDYRAGDQICSACGLVVGDRVIDVGSEWRTFSNESGGADKSRVGAAENTLLGSDLSTMIGPAPGGGRGGLGGSSMVSSDAAIYSYRNNNYSRGGGSGVGGGGGQSSSSSSSSDRALMDAFRTMANMSDRINLPRTITDRANVLFKVVYEGRNLKGRSNSAIAAACLYIACRQV